MVSINEHVAIKTMEGLPGVSRSLTTGRRLNMKRCHINICWTDVHAQKMEHCINYFSLKEEGQNCENYRDVNLFNSGYKICANTITRRIKTTSENVLI